MLRLPGESTSNSNRLSNGGIAVQIIFTRFPYLAAGDEVRPIKLFKNNRNIRFMQHSCIGCPNAIPQCGQGHPLCIHLLLQSLQSNEAIRLNTDRLVELRGKGEADRSEEHTSELQ